MQGEEHRMMIKGQRVGSGSIANCKLQISNCKLGGSVSAGRGCTVGSGRPTGCASARAVQPSRLISGGAGELRVESNFRTAVGGRNAPNRGKRTVFGPGRIVGPRRAVRKLRKFARPGAGNPAKTALRRVSGPRPPVFRARSENRLSALR